MNFPIKVLNLDLALPISDIKGLEGYFSVKSLISFHGKPIGYCCLDVQNNQLSKERIINSILKEHKLKILQNLIQTGLENPLKNEVLKIEELLVLKPPQTCIEFPLISVAVCTRDRTEQLEKCLESIVGLDYPEFEVVVIDNAPCSTDTELLILKKNFSNVRYIREDKPGLNWARNRAVQEAKGEIVAFADDDVVVDQKWLLGIAKAFEDKDVMSVTGLVSPLELETEAQILFEQYGGFGKGFERKTYQSPKEIVHWGMLGTGQLGTGANMAFRKAVFGRIGYFDPALDVGTITNGGGDLEYFFRVLKHRYKHVYEPDAIVFHKHRTTYTELKYQISNNSKGLVAYFVRSISFFPEQKNEFLKIWYWYFRHFVLKNLKDSYLNRSNIPRDLIFAELPGLFKFFLYKSSKKRALEINKTQYNFYLNDYSNEVIAKKVNLKNDNKVFIKKIDITQPICDIIDIQNHDKVKLLIFNGQQLIGEINIKNSFNIISKQELIPLISNAYAEYLLDIDRESITNLFQNYFNLRLINFDSFASSSLSSILKYKVSIVIATYDRPSDLKECLLSLMDQKTIHELEIIVVDNNPKSNLTAPILRQFPDVVFVTEPRKGLSVARNKGIRISSGDIILSTDDDVICPPNWVQNITMHFANEDVMIVTGNVIPKALDNSAQILFEEYGGLGRGFKIKEVNRVWFDSFQKTAVPTWLLGACANAAFRKSIFYHPRIGMFDETLGAGTPSGCSEDTYIFYKTLKEGFTLIYEPRAYVRHKHRNTLKALKTQLYNYSKGHVAYNFKTWWNDNDSRGLWRIFYELPIMQFRRIGSRLIRKSNYSLSLVLIETLGSFIGPLAIIQSWINYRFTDKTITK